MSADRVDRARERAAAGGFERSSDREVGALLRVLAAAVPPDGRVLELGTGVGVGLAWIVGGVEPRTDVEVVSVEADADRHAAAAREAWPGWVRLVHGDAGAVSDALGMFDLVFADAEGGKTTGLDRTLSLLRPGGVLVVDDMREQPDDEYHASLWPRLLAVRDRLLTDPTLVAAELDWSTGVIVATRRP